jgi:hypothetical protein
METKHIEKKTVTRYKFDISLAKKIQNKEIEGKIVTRDGRNVRILCFDRNSIDCIVVLIDNKSWEMIESYTSDGALYDLGLESPLDLFIERSINC